MDIYTIQEEAYRNGYEAGVKSVTDNNVAYKLKATDKDTNVLTNADRIRAMSDEELKYIARAVIESQDCPMGETECIDCVFHDLCVSGEYYYNNEEEWIKQPSEVDNG